MDTATHPADGTADDARAADATSPKRTPFERTKEPSPDDMVTVRIPRELYDQLVTDRDRIDPPVDGWGVKRQPAGIDRHGARLITYGLRVSRARVPDYIDPTVIDDGSV